MRIDLGAGVGTARMKRRGLVLRRSRATLPNISDEPAWYSCRLAPAPLIVIAQRFEQSQRAETDHIGRILRLIERNAHVRLRREIVDLVGTHLLDDAPQPGAISEIAIVQLQALGARDRSPCAGDRCVRLRSSRCAAPSRGPRSPSSAETPRGTIRPVRSRRLSMLLLPSESREEYTTSIGVQRTSLRTKKRGVSSPRLRISPL